MLPTARVSAKSISLIGVITLFFFAKTTPDIKILLSLFLPDLLTDSIRSQEWIKNCLENITRV